MMTNRQRQQRNEIKAFCRDFLQGNDSTLHEILTPYRHMFIQIDIQFTEDTFTESFQRICYEAFPLKSPQQGYVVALLGFAENIHKYHIHNCPWYSIDIMLDTLLDVLEEFGFDPRQLQKTIPSRLCILL